MKNNIAPASFENGSFPAVLIKSINIHPSGASWAEDRIGGFRFSVDIVLQAHKDRAVPTMGLLVAAILRDDYFEILKSNHRYVEGLIRGLYRTERDVTLNGVAFIKAIGVSGAENQEGALMSYNASQSSLVYNKTITTDFSFDFPPTNLKLMVVPYYNNPTEENSLGAIYGMSDAPLVVGRPTVETILLDKRPPLTSSIFRLRESSELGKVGELWCGPVHSTRSGLMAGASHIAEFHPAIQTTQISNQKIKDFRLKLATDALGLPGASLGNAAVSHFGDVHYSRDLNNEVAVMIPFNLHSYIKENFAFSNLIKNDSSLLSCALIEDIKVFRSRVQENDLGSKLTPDKNSACNNCYKTPPTLIGTLKEGRVKLLDLPGRNQMIHHIFVKDTYMADAEQSHFEYTVEIEMLDNTPRAVQLILKKLDIALYDYESYLFALENHENPNQNYQTFINVNAQRLAARTDWKKIIVEFVSAINFIYGTKNTAYKSIIEWAHKMLPLANPYSATLDSANELKEMIAAFYGRLATVYQKSPLQRSEAPRDVRQKMDETSSSVRRLKVIHPIKQTYYNKVGKAVGFDYLGEFLSTPNGIEAFRRVTRKQYIERATAEMNKYGLSSPSALGVNKFGYMSPRQIRISQQTITTGMEMDLIQSYDLYQANLFPSTTEKNFLGNPGTFANESILANIILNHEGVSYNSLQKSIATLAAVHTSPLMPALDAALYFTDTSAFVFDNISQQTAIQGSNIPAYIYSQNLQKWKDLIQNTILENSINAAVTSYTPVIMKDIEKIKSSFAYEQMSYDATSLASMNLFEIEINFNSVVKIEYFSGYDKSISAPVWRTLSPTMMADIKENAAPAQLCRITEVGSLFNQPNIFKLPTFNEYFVLGGPVPLTGMALRSPYEQHYNRLRSSVQAAMSNDLLNTVTKRAACFPQYTTSRASIYRTSQDTPASLPVPKAGMNLGAKAPGSATGGSY